MHENHKLCSKLKTSEVCLVVEQYGEGKFTRQHHEHVPKSRLSTDKRLNLLRALVIVFSGMGFESIVACHLNARGKTLAGSAGRLRMAVAYPEPGVLRTYCGTNTHAWSDQVIAPSQFRRSA